MTTRTLWVVLEVEEAQVVPVGLELLGRARKLADERGFTVGACLFGHGVTSLSEEAIRCGADRVWVADHEALAPYTTTVHTELLAGLVTRHKPDILLLGATHNGRDLAGRLAVRLKTGLTADCTDLEIDPESSLLKGWVVGFGGGIAACITCPAHTPQMATVRPGVFPKPAGVRRRGTIERVEVGDAVAHRRERVLERRRQEVKNLAGAEVLVVGGRGVQGRFDLLHALCERLGPGAEVGATRVAVDAGWADRERQIGQTGVVMSPRLVMVFGASGATHFMVGIDKAETVIAVTLDPEAPIVDQADYVVVADALTLLPELTKQLS